MLKKVLCLPRIARLVHRGLARVKLYSGVTLDKTHNYSIPFASLKARRSSESIEGGNRTP